MDIENKLRTLYVGKILFEHTDEDHFLTTEQIRAILVEEYGLTVHRQTIPTDIDILKTFGMEIECVRATQNRYYLVKRKFETAEIKLLIDAVESSKFISNNMSNKLTAKVASLAGNNKADELKRNMSVEGRIKYSNEKLYRIIDDINYAINRKCKISFHYFRYDADKKKVLRNDGEEYIFSPYSMIWNGDNYYVVGWADKYDKVCQFRVDRFMNSPKILEDKAVSKPKDFNINEYINTMFSMFDSERAEVKLICDNSVMDSVIGKFGEKVRTEAINENEFEADVTIAVNNVFFSWVFGFGGKVKIAGPESVKDEYKKMVMDAVDGLR